MKTKSYICIDLKSFYASVECVERSLDPLTTNLVVADSSRTDKTICLAVSPSLKSFGIPGRPRLFEVLQQVKKVNIERKKAIGEKRFNGESYNLPTLLNDPTKKLSFIIATPRMAKYVEVSTKIYDIYLKYVAPEDMHVYSIDEVFIDATDYLKTYGCTPHEFAMKMIKDVLSSTGITATVGIGSNLYLAKIAMDIVAKKMPPDRDGVRIAELDERSYREKLWAHTPLRDFWRVGPGLSERLAKYGIFTMGDIARCSLGKDSDFYNEELLYKEFGVNAELLIDHAWGIEPTEICDIKSYKPTANSLSTGQVLSFAYTCDKAKIVVKEMANTLALDLVAKKLFTNLLTLTIGYDIDYIETVERFDGEIVTDKYGRKVPKGAHGSSNLGYFTCSATKIVNAVSELFDRIVDNKLHVRRITIAANTFFQDEVEKSTTSAVQLSLFDEQKIDDGVEEKDRKVSESIIKIKDKYGKNSILKGMDYEEGGTTRERNKQIGGHKA